MLRGIALLLLLMSTLFGQNRVSPEMMYHRVFAIVPLIGSGKPDDPRRPMFTPSPAEQAAKFKNGDRTGVIGYSMQLSDDGKSALVEFMGENPSELKFIVNSQAAGVIAFERGTATKEQIQAAFQKYKAGFTLSTLGTSAAATSATGASTLGGKAQ